VFMLHEGTKVDVLDQINDWKKIKIANGNVGWTQEENLEII
jgi:SH3-like domain-containing protein